MTKRVFVIHGWGLSSDSQWFPWLKDQLTAKGFEVYMPQMPDTKNPKIDAWVGELAKTVGTPDGETYFIGHSMGCQTILRYLEGVDVIVGGAIFLAGFFYVSDYTYQTNEDRQIMMPWVSTPINFDKVRENLKKSIAIFSDNDPFVPVTNAKDFEKKVGSEIVIESGKGHFVFRDKVYEVPEVVEALLKVSE